MSDATPWKPADTMDAILQFVWDAALKSCTVDDDQEAAKALALDKAREMLDADFDSEDAADRAERTSTAGVLCRCSTSAPRGTSDG